MQACHGCDSFCAHVGKVYHNSAPNLICTLHLLWVSVQGIVNSTSVYMVSAWGMCRVMVVSLLFCAPLNRQFVMNGLGQGCGSSLNANWLLAHAAYASGACMVRRSRKALAVLIGPVGACPQVSSSSHMCRFGWACGAPASNEPHHPHPAALAICQLPGLPLPAAGLASTTWGACIKPSVGLASGNARCLPTSDSSAT